ncbi:RAS protein activator like-3 isoform X3 [Meriones unguiculatus]|uniref:RAS protein activator like-3 isoform X3 n=1 Tax=Meriones unguiculatus TaxID=10047 RepID=UPI00293E4F72|nr:RAS protein activator like-3 isoform X3 [Meriones unguiculatus]
MKTKCGQAVRRTVTFWSRSRDSAMDPPSQSEASQTQQPEPPEPPSPLTAYRWHTGGGGEKTAGAFRWGRFTGWGRALSHQEPMVSKQPAPRSLFRRVLSAPPKESRPNRLRFSKTLWGRHKNAAPFEPKADPKAPEPELELAAAPELPVAQIPEAPTPDMPVWDIGGFTLLEGRLVLLGEEEGPRQIRMGSASSESSMQSAMGNLRDPDRTPGKTESEATASNQVHNVRGLLKRLKEKKRSRSELGAHTARDGPPSALGSRESLATLSEVDLGAEKDVRVWPLHPSLLGEPYCFQVTWAGGSRCFSCRSSAERDRWIEELRRQFQPSQDNVERQETWLTVWVHEAKGLPRAGAPGVRAELWLDGALLARTAPRAGPGPLFWAERFHFEALPPARRLSLRLRGAGPAGASVGRVVLELDEVSRPRAPAAGLERWFPVLGAPAGAALRARVRARRLRVLPSERYKELAEFLTFHYARLCGALEPALSAQAKEELAAAMVRVLRATGRAQALVTDLGTAELARCGGREALLFRENTLATKAIDEYMKLVAQEYLQETLGQVVRCLCASTEDCEVDPSKCPAPELPKHQARLRSSCEEVFENIIHSYKFGEKEAYMTFMNSFLKDHGPAMQHFLDQVAMVDADATPSGYQGSGDLALQLAVLHVQLCTIFAELDQTTQDSLEPLPTILRAIEEGRPVPVSVPMHLPRIPTQVHSSFSSGEKPGFLAPRDLPKHTPLISKSQSLRSFQGAGSWTPRCPDEEPPQRRPRPVQRTQSVPAGRPARRRPSAGPRPQLQVSSHTGPAPCRRAWTRTSTSLPRKPSVPWQRQLDQPGDRYRTLGTHRPMSKLAEIQCEVAALREEQRTLSHLVESLSTHIQNLTEQQEQLRCQLRDLDSRLGAGFSKVDSDGGLPSNGSHGLKSLERRLTEMEGIQEQLRETLQSLQLLPGTPEARCQPLPLKAPCVNGAELSTGT